MCTEISKICLRCGKPFHPKGSGEQKYCGSRTDRLSCAWTNQREQESRATKKWHKSHPEYYKEWRRNQSEEGKERRLAWARTYYHKHQKKEDEQNLRRKLRIKVEYMGLLGSRCQLCGYNKYMGALEFHHMSKDDKERKEDWKYKSFRNKIEAGKIMLLCANCHREIHNGFC